jgi:NAD-dependent SIR2 family protein deacetylase
MHGNVRYMHCSNDEKDCCRNFYTAPHLSEVKDKKNHVPLCKECQSPMKPHCMFFDESYNECYYRDMTTRKMEDDMDAFIVIGTALATGGAKSMVSRTLTKKEIPIFEFNMDPCIDRGFVFHVTEKCETALDKFFNEFYRLMAGGKPKKPQPIAKVEPQKNGAAAAAETPAKSQPQASAST